MPDQADLFDFDFDCDFDNITQEFEIPKELLKTQCECGAEKCDSNYHSDWCKANPNYKEK